MPGMITLFFTILALYGTKVLFQPGMILEGPKNWLDMWFIERGNAFTRKLSKPLYACPPCMSSIWGSLVYWWGNSFTWNTDTLFFWPVFVLSACAGTWILLYQFPFDE